MRREISLATVLGGAAASVLEGPVCIIPWLHGGAVSLARFVLQAGAILAGFLSLFGGLLRRGRTGYPPVIFVPGLFVAIGVIQLLPVHAPLIRQMNHAVHSDQRHDLLEEDDSLPAVRTASPADTRMLFAQLMAYGIDVCSMVASDEHRSRWAAMMCQAVLTANALALSCRDC